MRQIEHIFWMHAMQTQKLFNYELTVMFKCLELLSKYSYKFSQAAMQALLLVLILGPTLKFNINDRTVNHILYNYSYEKKK